MSMNEIQGRFDDKRKEEQSLQCFWCRPAENHKEDGAGEHTKGCQKPLHQTKPSMIETGSFKKPGNAAIILRSIILMWYLSSGIFNILALFLQLNFSFLFDVMSDICSVKPITSFLWLFFPPNWQYLSSFHTHVPYFWELLIFFLEQMLVLLNLWFQSVNKMFHSKHWLIHVIPEHC